MPSVVLLSPSPYSAYSLALLDGMNRRGIEVSLVVVRRLINPKRVLHEFRRDRDRLIQKVIKRLILRNRTYASSSTVRAGLGAYLLDHGLDYEPLRQWCSRNDVPIIKSKDHNSPDALDAIGAAKPDAIVFTGGGLLREALLDLAPFGVINGHAGILPDYRGMDVPEWAVLQGEFKKIGVTVHVMDQGIDTGPLLRRYPIDIQAGDTLESIRGRIEYLLAHAMTETVCDYLNGVITPIPQSLTAGRQYFIMHPLVRACARRRLSEMGS